MKRGLIGLVGVALLGLVGMALFIDGCVLFMKVSQTATHANVFVRQLPGGGSEYTTATPQYPTYPLAQQMGQLWSPEALVYVNLYLSVLAVCVGVTLLLIAIRGLGTQDDSKHSGSGRGGWVALLMAVVVGVVLAGVVLANVFGQGPPIPAPPWDPAVFMWALLSSQTALAVLAMSVLLSLVGLSLRFGSGRAGWLALLIALAVGVALANLSGWVFPPLDPCWGVLGCPPWNPGPFGPPIGMLVHIYPLIVLAVLAMSVLLSLVGFALARRTRGALTPVVVHGLQLAPLLAVTLIGLAPLFLFPLPYTL